jgi:hypothetical protein
MRVEAGGEGMSMTGKILEYGVPVEIQPPPQAETMEADEFEDLTGG